MNTMVLSDRTDEQLINEYLYGNNNALGGLYSRYSKKVYQKCFSFTKNPDDAFDYAQDILIKAFQNIKTFKGESRFSTWLYAITHNYCISQVSKAKKMRYKHIDTKYDLREDSSDFETRAERETLEQEIDKYLDELSEADKEILEMKYRQNYSITDLQKKLNLSASAVKMRLLRARQKVEQIYNCKHIIT